MPRSTLTLTLTSLFALAPLGACSHPRDASPGAEGPRVRPLPTQGAPMTPDEFRGALAGPSAEASDAVDGEPEPAVARDPRFGPNVRSLVVTRAAPIKSDPLREADTIGIISRGTRVAWRGHAESPDCPHAWIQLRPRGWICVAVEPSEESPSTEVLPRVGRGRVPGTSGRVRRSGQIYDSPEAVRAGDGRTPQGDVVGLSSVVRIDGKRYWRTQRGEYVAASNVHRFSGSNFEGVRLGRDEGLQLPVGFALSASGRGRERVIVRERPEGRAPIVRRLDRRAVVAIAGASEDGVFVRIGEDEWVARRDLRIAEKQRPPSPEIARERWLDVDLDAQLVVVYDGTEPVFATLTSTGRGKHRTPTGVYRVTRKVATTTMNSRPGAAEVYSVANVPWVLYFHEGYAAHGTYWHDGFGFVRSHGCLNLAPADAEVVYGLLSPQIPPGWSQIHGTEEHPGAAIRIRSGRDPDPNFRGYAAALNQQAERARATTRLATRD